MQIGIPQMRGIDIENGLSRVMKNEKLFITLLIKFAKSRQSSETELMQALNTGDYPTARRVAHTIKGVAGNIGAVELYELASSTESVYKQEGVDSQEALQAGQKLIAEFTLVADDILLKLEGPPQQSTNSMATDAEIGKLKKLLSEYDGSAVSYFEEISGKLAASTSEEKAKKIGDYIRSYDFESAIRELG